MAWTNLEDFVGAVPLDRYLQLHPWFGGWAEDPLGDVLSAWRLYKQAKVPALGFLLLGETKIRIDPTLVQGFGLMSAAGVQDPEVVRMVAALKVQAWWGGNGHTRAQTGQHPQRPELVAPSQRRAGARWHPRPQGVLPGRSPDA